jgi:hypothetical protein
MSGELQFVVPHGRHNRKVIDKLKEALNKFDESPSQILLPVGELPGLVVCV